MVSDLLSLTQIPPEVWNILFMHLHERFPGMEEFDVHLFVFVNFFPLSYQFLPFSDEIQYFKLRLLYMYINQTCTVKHICYEFL